MTSQITPEDLQMLQQARKQAEATDQSFQQAKAALGQSQQQHLAAMGAWAFVQKLLTERYALAPGGSIDTTTGLITQGAS